ncbi:MAG: type IX secretion system membrane protein PorP/SprF [Flavobacteriales bacterium]|nr:type IX secretion system membrane protein PorP/SprF [Flavobacteriales bacterium]
MRGIATAAVCAVLGSVSFAQQDPQFTQYMFDRLSINPAVAGTTGQLCATALLRQQWTGFDGAPKTGLLNAHMPLAKISSGIGLSVYLDELGQQKSTFARLHYSFHRKLGAGTFGIGLYAGLGSHTLGRDWIATDGVATDAAIPDNGQSQGGFDLGAGLYYASPTFWIGLSSTHLPETELDDVSIKMRRHYWVQAGYDWKIGGDAKYVLQPSTLIKTDGTSTQFDVNATFLYNSMVWLGVSYRTEDAIAPMIGYQHKMPNGKSMLRVGYSYDVTTSQLRNYSSGSHEVMVNYCVLLEKKPDLQIYRNVRFL